MLAGIARSIWIGSEGYHVQTVSFANTSETKLRLYDNLQCGAGLASQTSNSRLNGIST